jgi:hypothetical protein
MTHRLCITPGHFADVSETGPNRRVLPQFGLLEIGKVATKLFF